MIQCISHFFWKLTIDQLMLRLAMNCFLSSANSCSNRYLWQNTHHLSVSIHSPHLISLHTWTMHILVSGTIAEDPRCIYIQLNISVFSMRHFRPHSSFPPDWPSTICHAQNKVTNVIFPSFFIQAWRVGKVGFEWKVLFKDLVDFLFELCSSLVTNSGRFEGL